jgi:hypothetical protein
LLLPARGICGDEIFARSNIGLHFTFLRIPSVLLALRNIVLIPIAAESKGRSYAFGQKLAAIRAIQKESASKPQVRSFGPRACG